jgi:hypothetical protein
MLSTVTALLAGTTSARAEGVDREARINVDGWKGVWTTGIDAVVSHPNHKVYFFKGDRYQRFDFAREAAGQNPVDREGRIGIDGWKGVWSNIDAAVLHPVNGKIYFFKGDRYQRFDFTNTTVARNDNVQSDSGEVDLKDTTVAQRFVRDPEPGVFPLPVLESFEAECDSPAAAWEVGHMDTSPDDSDSLDPDAPDPDDAEVGSRTRPWLRRRLPGAGEPPPPRRRHVPRLACGPDAARLGRCDPARVGDVRR